MTIGTATVDVVTRPASDAITIAIEIDALAALQARLSELEAAARELRSRVKEGMLRLDLSTVTSPAGHRATLSLTTRTEFDRQRAAQLLAPGILAEITRTVASTVLRVR
jgi:BMFP domain-containing protein YqiC